MGVQIKISGNVYVYKKQKIFSENKKDLGMAGLSYSTPQKSTETRGNAITQPRSHPIPKFYIFLMGWDRGWAPNRKIEGLAITHLSC